MQQVQSEVHNGNATASQDSRSRRGAALLFAISILGIFSALGMVYVRYMELEVDKSNFELRERRARQLAVAGIQSAAAGLQQFVLSPEKRPVELGSPYQIELPTYSSVVTEDSAIVASPMGAARLAEASFTIFDESAKVNINHAPASVLQKVLGISGEAARSIAASVPRAGGSTEGAWFLDLGELAARDLDSEVDAAVLAGAMTPYSVLQHGAPSGYLNINAASPTIVGAVLDLSPEQTTQVLAKGPFSSRESLGRAVAEVRGVPAETIVIDEAVGFQSLCFRVVCEGRYARFIDEERYRQASNEEKRKHLMNVTVSRVEAVLLFSADGSYDIIRWNVDVDIAA